MPTITFTVGPPGAGKSRWAHAQIAERGLHAVQRVNLDDFLTMTAGRAFHDLTASDLKLTKQMMISAIRSIAESGRDVIVDNTHLSTRFPTQVREELGDQYDYAIKDFTVVPLQECIDNDAVRHRLNPAGHVGEEEVTKQHMKGRALQARMGGPGMPYWVEELNRSDEIEPYKADESLPKAVIVDIDGTLALNTSRSPYDTSRYHTDELETRLATLIDSLTTAADPYQVIVVTGRDAEFRPQLEEWLARHRVYYDEIYMRPQGDTRRDNVIKLELFNAHVRDRFNVIAVFDDRDRVVRLWRRLGLLTCQVNYGAF